MRGVGWDAGWVEKRISPLGGNCAARSTSLRVEMTEFGAGRLGEFLKGYMRKKLERDECGAGYSQDGDSRGLAQACDKAKCFRSAGQRC